MIDPILYGAAKLVADHPFIASALAMVAGLIIGVGIILHAIGGIFRR